MRGTLCVASVAAVVTAFAAVGCGGRLVPERDAFRDAASESDAGEEAGDAGADADASDSATNDVAVSELDGSAPDACAVVTAPLCVPTATCGAMYLLTGQGLEEGYFHFETVDVPCQSPPTIVQQLINGTWTQLPSLANEYIPNSTSPDTYIIGSQFPFTAPQEGATVGSVQAIRGCTITGACTVCDPPSNITVLQCGACLPKVCGPGSFLDESCYCATDICPCPLDSYPACVTPAWECF